MARTYLLTLVLILTTLIIKAQRMEQYQSDWQKVEEFQKKSLPKSALGIVNIVYEKAKKSGNNAQMIKALLFRANMLESQQENADINTIKALESEIQETRSPETKALLESITAQLYWQYFNRNRYKFYDRTNIASGEKGTLDTWTIENIHERIGQLYLQSLQPKDLLQRTKIDQFNAIVKKGTARYLRPSLYDFLAFRALEYFTNEERMISKPAYAFLLNDPQLLAPAQNFVKVTIKTQDTTSLHFHALKIFQDLLNKKEEDPAFWDANIQRLEFVYRNAVMERKDSLYINALLKIYKEHEAGDEGLRAAYLAAEKMFELAPKDAMEKAPSEYAIAEAVTLLQKITSAAPKSRAGVMAANMLSEIHRPEIRLTNEMVNIPGKPFLTLVTYKNTDEIYGRILKVTPALKKLLRNEEDKTFSRLITEKPIRSFTQNLPSPADFKTHRTEIKTDALPVGEYVLIISLNSSFSMSKNALAYQKIYISNISYVNNGMDYFVLNRTTGEPLIKATVQLWNEKYDYKSRSYILKKQDLYTTNNHGHFQINPSKDSDFDGNIRLQIHYGQDSLFTDERQYRPFVRYFTAPDTDTGYMKNNRFYIFTDRSIYRPGQKVYFKAIGITKGPDNLPLIYTSKDSVTAQMIDANGSRVDSIKLKINEFGSVSGDFTLPQGRMTGNYTIQIPGFQYSAQSISVEEYKRPKFFTEIQQPAGEYKVNDTVMVQGKATAYAGNAISNARVSYRVVREPRFVYPWRIMWLPQVQPMEIAQGETETDESGNFQVSFKAIPDLSLDTAWNPVFDYRLMADVTDVNGETRSANIVVPVSYQSLLVHIEMTRDEMIAMDSLKSISIKTENINGKKQETTTTLRIFKLKEPQGFIREKLWETPDVFVMDREEFKRDFPLDAYGDELNKESWPRDREVTSITDSANKKLDLDVPVWENGWYLAEAVATDRDGRQVKDMRYFRVYGGSGDSKPYFVTNKMEAQPGEKVRVQLVAAEDAQYLIRETSRWSKEERDTSSFDYINLKKKEQTFDYDISEKDRGGFETGVLYVVHNRVYAYVGHITVDWLNKQLDISFDTYRDKTLPGSKEEWTVTITGKQGDKAAAEMLASMYDASLDQFKTHKWQLPQVWPQFSGSDRWTTSNFEATTSRENPMEVEFKEVPELSYDRLNYLPSFGRVYFKAMGARQNMEVATAGQVFEVARPETAEKAEDKAIGQVDTLTSDLPENNAEATHSPTPTMQPRTNFNETAFFYPTLKTDKDGKIRFSFTMPEALTTWKMMALAHTTDLAFGYNTQTVITQKELMVQPLAPRFLREGDKIVFNAKVVNQSGKIMSGTVTFELLNAKNMNVVSKWFEVPATQKQFNIKAGGSEDVEFELTVPKNFNEAVIYRITAQSGENSDGEQALIPVLTNQMLVTESMPLPMTGNGTKVFNFEKILKSDKSSSLHNWGLTVEYTPNPAWYAVQALPFLEEGNYSNTVSHFSRFYANALAQRIAGSNPKIREIFEEWKSTDTAALLSNLQKNEELKYILLEETPWVMAAKSEEEQKRNIALLFDMTRMQSNLQNSWNKLREMQSVNGGFVWLKGAPEDRYMTQYVITGLGRLAKLGGVPVAMQSEWQEITQKGLAYLDARMKEDYEKLLRSKTDLKNNQLTPLTIHLLYMYSYFDYKVKNSTAYKFYMQQARKFWPEQSNYMKGLIAVAMTRSGDTKTYEVIVRSLKENAIVNEELGMYWKDVAASGYWWYQAPVEAQSVMVEVFAEGRYDKEVNRLKTWLLKNKQANSWKTTKATADAVYALLLQGEDLLSEDKRVVIKAGDVVFDNKNEVQESGTGYFKRRIDGSSVRPTMGKLEVSVSGSASESTSWGAVYWQYFEDLDKISFAETPLKLSKKLFVERNTARGPVLHALGDNNLLQVGDKVVVRIELRSDRDMEYVHMKDMRASAFEPVNVMTSYKWQGGLGYVESTRDAATNFFFPYLRKGTYVFEYSMFVTNRGNFSNGITTIQSMYAPEFMAHSEGVRVRVD